MATAYAIVTTPGADIDSLCDDLELEANISDATVEGAWESDGLTNPGTDASVNTVRVKITGTATVDITNAISAVGSLTIVTDA